MIDKQAKKARQAELVAEVKSLLADKRITGAMMAARMDEIEAEDAQIETELKNHKQALEYRMGNELGDLPPLINHKGMGRGNQIAPLAFDRAHVKAMHQAVMSRQSFQIHAKNFNSPVSQL